MNVFKKIFYLIFGEPSFTKAVKHIEAALSKLDKAVVHQVDKSAFLKKVSEDALKGVAFAEAEAEKARRVASKFAELLS